MTCSDSSEKFRTWNDDLINNDVITYLLKLHFVVIVNYRLWLRRFLFTCL